MKKERTQGFPDFTLLLLSFITFLLAWLPEVYITSVDDSEEYPVIPPRSRDVGWVDLQ